MDIKRQAINHLLKWKTNNTRKPLILRGARQVGKTTLVKQLAQSYTYHIFINLEKSSDRIYFEQGDNVKTILEKILFANNIPYKEIANTLLFIDEIQESPKAIHLLRYFYEDIPELHVIAAGSLLEFALRHVSSFPVGRVEFLYLYPLNFAEYLGAIGHDIAYKEIDNIPINDYAHDTLLNLFKRYAIIGGMPEVVKTDVITNNIADLIPIYESIWETYKNDVERYSQNEIERKVIKHIMNTAHLYVDQRIKFQHFGNSNYKSREVSESIRALDDAKVIQIIYPTTDIVPPLRPDLKKSPRLQFLDTGLINHSLGIQGELLVLKDLSNAYKGAIIPHLICQEITSINKYSHRKPAFWVREKKQSDAEVDLLYTYQEKIIPIEIKSGNTGTLRSLHQFMEVCNHPYAIRIYGGELKIEKVFTQQKTEFLLLNLPYYLGTKIPEYVTWFIEDASKAFLQNEK